MSNGILQGAGTASTPKQAGRLEMALDPMTDICNELESLRRRLERVADKFLGPVPPRPTTDVVNVDATPDTLEFRIKDMVASYSAMLEGMQDEVSRLESV